MMPFLVTVGLQKGTKIRPKIEHDFSMIFEPLWAPFWLHFGTLWASIWNQNPTFWRPGPRDDYFELLRHPPDVNFRPKMNDFGPLEAPKLAPDSSFFTSATPS